MIYLGKICEVKGSLVRVDYLGTKSPLLPYMQTANAFKRHFSPPKINEQVIIFDLGGLKVALGSFLNANFDIPSTAGEQKEVIEYSDGTIISYDAFSSTLEVLNAKTLNLLIQNDINITCQKADIKAQNTTITSPSVMIKGNTTIQGSITTSGGGGEAGSFDINGNLSIKGDLVVSGNVTDSRGDLTGHAHNDTDGYISNPR